MSRPDRGDLGNSGVNDSRWEAARSWLYVPATRERMLASAAGRGADVVIVDLEDGVPPREKGAARERILSRAARDLAWAGDRWALRVNPPGTTWHDDDLRAAQAIRPPAIVVPKVEDPSAIASMARVARGWGGVVAAMIETARGATEAAAIASSDRAVAALIVGSADLRRSIGARPDDDRSWERHVLAEVLLAARASSCAAVDSVYFRFRDAAGLERHARVARDLGYDGKTCIHPSQIPVVHRVFSSTPDEIAWAEAVIAGWEREDGARRGVVVVDGEMIEALHLKVARRPLDRRPPDGAPRGDGR